ncbi:MULTISPECIES: hypothetical protein [Frankia]|uniref:Uncharacterized protein n=1 Tax=Frankia alni (strain DSM 45986 / CECT 9034 / ACN14a) TaxID=326424 RepID=Q0RKP5_FRAAA|nr:MULTISPECIES: hypothetical protein [Frankia]CAJ61910.1 hypothetical protein; putative peptidase domain [Frankia alni ACN14a]
MAGQHLLRWGADVELADVVRDAIAGHLDPATVGDPRPEVAGLILGALVDALGVGLADVPAALVDDILTGEPRRAPVRDADEGGGEAGKGGGEAGRDRSDDRSRDCGAAGTGEAEHASGARSCGGGVGRLMGRRPARRGVPSPADVPRGLDPAVLDVVPVPAGLWARAPGMLPPAPDEPALHALPPRSRGICVIVGAPGEPVPDVPVVADLLRAMPAADDPDGMHVVRYGVDPADGPCLPQRLADRLGRPVLAQHGLLLTGADGWPRVSAIDVGRACWWHPLAEQSVYPPAGPPRVARWRAPAPWLTDLGGGYYRLQDDWLVQVVPAGIALRHAGWPADPDVDAAPHDPGRFDLLLDAPAAGLVAGLSDGLLTALGRLADALPGPARLRLRVVLPAGLGTAQALRLRWAVPAPQQVRSGPSTTAPANAGSPAGEPAAEAPPPAESLAEAPPPAESTAEESPERAPAAAPQGAPERPIPVPATLLAVTRDGRVQLVRPSAVVVGRPPAR